MIDWTNIKSKAAAVIADLSGVTVKWEDEAQGTTWTGDPCIFLRVSALTGQGIPEERAEMVSRPETEEEEALEETEEEEADETEEDDEDQITNRVVTVSAQKRFTLSLRCESFNDDLSSGKHAGNILETVKTRLKRSTTIERLRGYFCFQEHLGTNWFNYISQGRQVSCYVMDFGCATVDNDIDDSDEQDGSFINEVKIKSDELLDAAGDPINTQVDLDITGGA